MTIVKSWQESKALTVIPASNTRNLIPLLPQPYILMLPQERHCFRTNLQDFRGSIIQLLHIISVVIVTGNPCYSLHLSVADWFIYVLEHMHEGDFNCRCAWEKVSINCLHKYSKSKCFWACASDVCVS